MTANTARRARGGVTYTYRATRIGVRDTMKGVEQYGSRRNDPTRRRRALVLCSWTADNVKIDIGFGR